MTKTQIGKIRKLIASRTEEFREQFRTFKDPDDPRVTKVMSTLRKFTFDGKRKLAVALAEKVLNKDLPEVNSDYLKWPLLAAWVPLRDNFSSYKPGEVCVVVAYNDRNKNRPEAVSPLVRGRWFDRYKADTKVLRPATKEEVNAIPDSQIALIAEQPELLFI